MIIVLKWFFDQMCRETLPHIFMSDRLYVLRISVVSVGHKYYTSSPISIFFPSICYLNPGWSWPTCLFCIHLLSRWSLMVLLFLFFINCSMLCNYHVCRRTIFLCISPHIFLATLGFILEKCSISHPIHILLWVLRYVSGYLSGFCSTLWYRYFDDNFNAWQIFK